jgi:hypothetical protein
MSETTVIKGKENIMHFRKITLLKGLELEIKGMSRRGRSCYSIIKEEFGFKGSKEKVRDQLQEHINSNG